MIAMKDGTKVFLHREWNESVRSTAVYHARKLGGTPATKTHIGSLFVWPASVEAAVRREHVRVVEKIARSLNIARRDAALAIAGD